MPGAVLPHSWRHIAKPMLIGIALISAVPARAEDLAEAIAEAYDSNPTLLSQRAQLQATDELFVQARAGFRPTVNAQVMATYNKAPVSTLFPGSELESNAGSGALSVEQPLYTGGRATAEVQGALAQINAGREQLRAVEAQVLFDVIQAYCDVLRDRAALAIQRDSLKELRAAVDEIRARREAGAATRTDVSQAEAQLESSEALVSSAQAQLEVSVAGYVATVGRSPGDLAALPPLPGVPTTIEEALSASDRESPSIRQARFAEAASRAQVRQARAAFRPTVTLNGSLGYTGQVEPFIRQNYQRAAALSVTFSQPLFAGGMIASHARQALAEDTAARLQVDVSERSAVQEVSSAWSQRHAAHLNTAADEAAAQSARTAFEGMRVEYRAGLRATLDVLIAQEALRDAQVALATAQHDEYVAEASLLGAVGRLEAGLLTQGLPLYRPEAALKHVQRSGAVPWQEIPVVLDKIGAPSLLQPGSLPEGKGSRESGREITTAPAASSEKDSR
jgi:outer membrane protein